MILELQREQKKSRIAAVYPNTRKTATFTSLNKSERKQKRYMSTSENPVEFIESSAPVEEKELGVEENISEERRSNSATGSKTFSRLREKNLAADTQFKFDIAKNYPTDRGHYPSTIQDTAL